MSWTSKAVFALSTTSTLSIIVYVHYKQQYDREQIHLGVIRDQERQERRKRENLYILEKQIALGKELKKGETETIS